MHTINTSLRPVARLRAVFVNFSGTDAVSGVSLDIEPGAVTTIAGPNGAGKSTLLEVIAGTRAPSSGTRFATGSVAFVPQRTAISDRLPLTVRDVVRVGACRRACVGWRRMDARARAAVDDALARLGIENLASSPFAALSGGQRQRTLLAQGVARQAELLLLDEPTTGLDVESATRIRSVIRAEAARGAAVVCVSHDAMVLAEADRLIRLESGRIIADQRP